MFRHPLKYMKNGRAEKRGGKEVISGLPVICSYSNLTRREEKRREEKRREEKRREEKRREEKRREEKRREEKRREEKRREEKRRAISPVPRPRLTKQSYCNRKVGVFIWWNIVPKATLHVGYLYEHIQIRTQDFCIKDP
ncbi:hypothetical protein GRJ2_001562500 [Grus japonensis]|uniref:Uncharacterized protein n=1 Tax=Grus japonensis TaxID=30415 RepID=A0ABC9X263_GRUJA